MCKSIFNGVLSEYFAIYSNKKVLYIIDTCYVNYETVIKVHHAHLSIEGEKEKKTTCLILVAK